MKKIVLAAALCSSFLFAGNSTEEFFYQSGYDQGQKDGFDKGVREAFKVAKKVLDEYKEEIRAYEIGKLKIESAQAGLNAANSAYKTIKAKYEAGLIDNVAYLSALTDKYSAQSALKVALNDLELKKANIIYYSGEKLEEYIK